MPTDFVRDVTYLRIIIFCKKKKILTPVVLVILSRFPDGRSQLFVGLCMFLGEDNSL